MCGAGSGVFDVARCGSADPGKSAGKANYTSGREKGAFRGCQTCG